MSEERKILDGYLSRSKLAEQLGKHERTLERWSMLRIGPPITWVGRKPYYKIDSTRDWLRFREQKMPRARWSREEHKAATPTTAPNARRRALASAKKNRHSPA